MIIGFTAKIANLFIPWMGGVPTGLHGMGGALGIAPIARDGGVGLVGGVGVET